jgi:hypothetical protein
MQLPPNPCRNTIVVTTIVTPLHMVIVIAVCPLLALLCLLFSLLLFFLLTIQKNVPCVPPLLNNPVHLGSLANDNSTAVLTAAADLSNRNLHQLYQHSQQESTVAFMMAVHMSLCVLCC